LRAGRRGLAFGARVNIRFQSGIDFLVYSAWAESTTAMMSSIVNGALEYDSRDGNISASLALAFAKKPVGGG